MTFWLLAIAAVASTPAECPVADLNVSAQLILRGFQTKDFRCIRKMVIGAEGWFDGDRLKFPDDMTFKGDGNRRLDDILNEHGAVAIAEHLGPQEGIIFLIDKKYYPLFRRGEMVFLK